MKVWITKYALTQGIIEADGFNSHIFPGAIIIKPKYPLPFDATTFKEGDWFVDRESAISRAETMRKNGIERLKKEIQRLEEMKFE